MMIGHVTLAAERLRHLETIHARQPEVEHDQVGPLRARQGQRVDAVRGGDHAESAMPQVVPAICAIDGSSSTTRMVFIPDGDAAHWGQTRVIGISLSRETFGSDPVGNYGGVRRSAGIFTMNASSRFPPRFVVQMK